MSESKEKKRGRRKPFHEEFSEKVIDLLERELAPWQKPWEPARGMSFHNPVSGTVYKGVNRLNLAISSLENGFDDPRWMTMRQANEQGCHIRKGSKSTTIVYYSFTRERDKLDDAGRPVLGEDGKPERETVLLERPMVRFSRVFNGSQVDGLPPLELPAKRYEWEPQERAEALLKASGAVIKHDQADRAFYRPSTDEIHLPPRSSFDAGDKYYATALHELGHWTGHASRLDREFGPRGTQAYAREELRAEIASWMLGEDIGVGHDPGQHAAYVQNWIQALKEDPHEIIHACRAAEHIRDYVLELERELGINDREPERGESLADFEEIETGGEDAERGVPQKTAPERTWLTVAFRDKNEVKRLGARWDVDRKQWYAPAGTDLEPLRPWLAEAEQARDVPEPSPARQADDAERETAERDVLQEASSEKTWLTVAFRDKTEVKRLGARWDVDRKQWYAPAGTDLEPLRPWLAEAEQARDVPEAPSARRNDGAARDVVERDPSRETSPERTWLNVPYTSRNTAKKLGARWDRDNKRWYAPEGVDLAPLRPFLSEQQQERDMAVSGSASTVERRAEKPTALHVPYEDKELAKKLGARWDRERKQWYAPAGTDLEPLSPWLNAKEVERRSQQTIDPRQEFARKLEELGLDLRGELPVLDGRTHRVPVLAKNGKGLDGAYCLHGDGIPAGWAQNHITGELIKLRATGVVLAPEERERQQRERAERLREAEAERRAAYEAAASRCKEMWDRFGGVTDAPYLEAKGVDAFGVKQDGLNLIIPVRNVDGEMRGFQAIAPDGQKAFARGIEKKGNFHLIGGEDRDLSHGEILICEGYATGASLHMATDMPVAVAFDAGNLRAVAEAIRERHPNAAIIICADNDHTRENNVGVEKAKEAAQAVGGIAVIPEFSREEKARGLTDFNDLHRSRGLSAVREQVAEQELER